MQPTSRHIYTRSQSYEWGRESFKHLAYQIKYRKQLNVTYLLYHLNIMNAQVHKMAIQGKKEQQLMSRIQQCQTYTKYLTG